MGHPRISRVPKHPDTGIYSTCNESYESLQVRLPAQGCPIHEHDGMERMQSTFHITRPCVSHWLQTDGQLIILGAMFSEVF